MLPTKSIQEAAVFTEATLYLAVNTAGELRLTLPKDLGKEEVGSLLSDIGG